ncbi:MAG: hypothetical protein JNL32_15610, partial [Candidatus Kapabacteria bacterium]|nr:hypothetical protein [Candidatus Kapabacteria bacterium]
MFKRYSISAGMFLALLAASSLNAQQHRAPASNPPRVTANNQQTAEQAPSVQSPTAQTLYSHGDPTVDEQLTLEYINRARANPTAEGVRLATTTDKDVQGAYSYFKIDVNKVKQQFAGYPARPPVALHAKLSAAARRHSLDMQAKDFQGHTGSDGSNMVQRIQGAGHTTGNAWGENVAAYAKNAWHGHCGFNVDWGEQNQIELGHRQNIMNFTGSLFNEVGISAIPDANSSTQVGPLIVTHDFAATAEIYILGVVYKDKNNNGFYDAGEGISGVTITPSKGSYYTKSSASGGYAIPMKGVSGAVTLTASGNGVNEVKQITMGTQNIKIDFGQATTPGVILMSPPDAEELRTDSTKLQWMKVNSATAYRLQVATDADFTELIVNDSTVKDTTYTLRKLKNVSSYYWRAMAKTPTMGWGEYSPVYTFNVKILPLPIGLIAPADKAKLSSKSIPFSWNPSPAPIEEYYFEIATDTIFLDLIHYRSLTETSYTFTDSKDSILENVPYYWHVSAKNEAGFGDYSPYRTFTYSKTTTSVD